MLYVTAISDHIMNFQSVKSRFLKPNIVTEIVENFTNFMQIICYIHNKSTCSNKQSNLKHAICFFYSEWFGSCLQLKWYEIEILLQFFFFFFLLFHFFLEALDFHRLYLERHSIIQQQILEKVFFGFLSVVQITKQIFWLKV